MKFEQLPVVERLGEGTLHQPAFVIGLIVFEITLAGWLLFGVWPRWTKWIPAICFSLFATAALYQAVGGAESCGCFGRVKVNPWATFGMDVLLAAALFIWPPGKGSEVGGAGTETRGERKTRGLAYRVIGTGGAAAVALTLSLRQLPAASAAEAHGEHGAIGMIEAGGLTILEPREWIGHALPILPHLDIAERLKTGQWLAVLYHADCSTCREAVPGYERLAASHPVALLEMPHYAAAHDQPYPPGSRALPGRLTDAREWFATTPVAMLLDDGVVRDVAEGPAAVGAAVDWAGMKLTPR